MHRMVFFCSVIACFALGCAHAYGQAAEAIPARRGPDRVDIESTARIRQYTTDPSFLTEWVDYLPASRRVRSPQRYLGYVSGAPGKLTQPAAINAYFRELARSSRRVQVFSAGNSHEGREMVVAAIAEPRLLARLGSIKAAMRELAGVRGVSEARARALAGSLPLVYWITAGLHSTETGPPEMVMELAYRLAVSEQDYIQEIRRNVVTLITPVLEMDGRARVVDWYYRFLTGVTDLEDSPPRSPPYWGHYTFHDNNRDGLQASQPLTRNYHRVYHEYLPVVTLDLHESVPLLYVSTGTGPYNDTVDPITVTEWQMMASYEVNQATRLGLRGVWTWGFYTGWYPGYLFWVANNHNGVGRFFETFGNGNPNTFPRKLTDRSFANHRPDVRTWYRPWPAEKELVWSMRNNTNYMQTGVLASLQFAARHRQSLILNFWKKGNNAVEKGKREPPFAFVIPARQRDRGALRHGLHTLFEQRLEVHEASAGAKLDGGVVVEPGDFVVRMDQPYRNLAHTLLMKQEFPATAELSPYDDVAWSLDYMLGLELKPVADKKVLELEMSRLEKVPGLPGRADEGTRWLIEHRGQAALASLRWAIAETPVKALAEPWQDHPAGSLVIEGIDQAKMDELAGRFHLDAIALDEEPPVRLVDVDLPRVAVFHTWRYTQDSGWVRFSLEQLGIPYALINKDHLRQGELAARYDVIVIPSQGGLSFADMVHEIDSKWSPMPYTKTREYSSHGVIDSSEDITGGMGFVGLGHLHEFAAQGGLLLALGSGGALAAEGGIARGVTTTRPADTPGSHLASRILRPEHPVTWGYDRVSHVFRGNLPVYSVRDYEMGAIVMQFGTKTLVEAEREADKKAGIPSAKLEGGAQGEGRTRQEPQPLVHSGGVKQPAEIERMPALLDVPTQKGRVLLYSWNPMHRYQNHHDFGFVTNALIFFNDFPDMPSEKQMREREAAYAAAPPAG